MMKHVLAGLLLAAPALGQPPGRPLDWTKYQDMAVTLLQRYLRENTSNPPGNEVRAARFFQRVLEGEGIPAQVFEFAPGRANLYARLKGEGSKKPLILLNHTDVVQAAPERWRVDPFSGAMVEGYIWGRGALDMKGEGLLELMVFLIAHRERLPLKRDVIFLATGDEEVNDLGTTWMIQNQRALLDAEYVLTEGGENLIRDGKIRYFGIDVAEKAPFWLEVKAEGQSGHGSVPIADSAPNRLVRALARLLDWQPPVKIIPAVERFFREVAPLEPPERARKFRDIRKAIRDARLARQLGEEREYNYLLRSTVSLTMLKGARQTNVIPGEATANLDVRLLPGEDPKAFLEQVKKVLGDPSLKVEPTSTFLPPNASPVDSELYRLIEASIHGQFPGVVVAPVLLSGFTECQMFRAIGCTCYGYSPFLLSLEESATEHADNERVSVENVRQGLVRYWNVVSHAVQ